MSDRLKKVFERVDSRFQAYIFIAAVLAIAVAVTSAVAFFQLRGATTKIVNDTAPSVLNAETGVRTVADAHASAATDIMSGGAGNPEAYSEYAGLRDSLPRIQHDASESSTEEGEAEAITAASVAFAQYASNVERARAELQHGYPDGAAWFKKADDVQNTQVVPQWQKVADTNIEVMNRSMQRTDQTAYLLLAVAVMFQFALAAFLLKVLRAHKAQFKTRFTKQSLHPLVTLAMALTVLVSVAGDVRLFAAHHQVMAAKNDAFDSISPLTRATSTVYIMKSQESMWLIANGGGKAYEARFNELSAQVLNQADLDYLLALPDGQWEPAAQALAEAAVKQGRKGGRTQDKLGHVSSGEGLLLQAAHNVTFDKEGEYAQKAIVDFVRFVRIDRQVRVLDGENKHQEAIALTLGKQEGQSAWAFNQLVNDLDNLVTINNAHFNDDGDSALRHLWGGEVIVIVAMLLCAFLVYRALEPRVRYFA